MAELHLDNVTKRFGDNEAVKQIDLKVNDGEFFCVLGPPGAGKTTMLRLIVGLAKPDEGNVLIDGVIVNDVYPGERDISMIFQNLALYPNKTVYENIAFPLREHNIPKDEIDGMVQKAARTLHIEQLLERKPGKLSGGERQRVAIGRAIVRRPKAYLMDEPLANLDAKLRLEMRIELKRLQQELGQTLVYVTHDQIEALSMADRIAVMNEGEVQQIDDPDSIYRYPSNTFVATVVGSPPMNFLKCAVIRKDGHVRLQHDACAFETARADDPLVPAIYEHGGKQDSALLGIRPEDIRVYDQAPDGVSFPATVSVVEPLGQETILDIDFGDNIIKATIPPTQFVSENQAVFLTLDVSKLHLFDTDTKLRFYSSSNQAALVPVTP